MGAWLGLLVVVLFVLCLMGRLKVCRCVLASSHTSWKGELVPRGEGGPGGVGGAGERSSREQVPPHHVFKGF